MLFYLYIGAALLFDFAVGDPRWFPHPVRFVGWLCTFCEAKARSLAGIISLRWCGILAFLSVFGITVISATVMLATISFYHHGLALFFAGALLYFCVATGDLITHSRAVYRMLARDDIEMARKEVGNLVGRETAQLDKTTIARACIESVAENLVDGITAPLFWAFAGSLFAVWFPINPLFCAALGAVSYKAVNTMDSMYGYKNEAYREFGWFAARFDDAVNYLPARLSGLCVIGAALAPGYDYRLSSKIFFRDRLQNNSPNSGHTEASFAGALGIRLGGASSYFGEVVMKPLIGSELRDAVDLDIIRSNRLVAASAALFFLLGAASHALIKNLLT